MSQEPVEMAILVENGKVIQKFQHAVEYVEYEPENLLTICEALCAAAFEARDGIKPVGNTLKAELVERHRMTLTTRIAVMLNSLREDKTKSNGALAKTLVDTCLSEVF